MSPLYQMTRTTPTRLWNDSASVKELRLSIENGAVGATCNPVIVLGVLKKEIGRWRPRIQQILAERPSASEEEIAWQVVREISAEAASLLRPTFEQQGGKNGRLSIQTDPRLFRDSDAMLQQAIGLTAVAPNVIVKIPATAAGISAIEESTYTGISINATVSFTVSQCIAVAEAVERGLKRREAEGKAIAGMGPVCTIMVGRLDDWLKVVAEKRGIVLDPGCMEWAGVAVFKKAYRIFQQRGYRIRLLSAAFRNHFHWSELIGGDVIISPPYSWQVRLDDSDIEVRSRIDDPVPPGTVEELSRKFPDFRRAYEENGLTAAEFDSFGPTRRTLRQFIAACHELDSIIRDVMLPDPDAE